MRILSDGKTKIFRASLLLPPIGLLVLMFLFVYSQGALTANAYVELQKDWFYSINSRLSCHPLLIYNLTQLGDALIFLSILCFTILYAPKIWQGLVASSLFALLFSNLFKSLFSVPRPAAILDTNSFTIIGKTLAGHNSLPSGHSITVFSILVVLLLTLMPRQFFQKLLWTLVVILAGLILAFTRVGVGAHFPLDVLAGSMIGYLCATAGLLFNQRFKLLYWMSNKKLFPVFLTIIVACIVALVQKIIKEPLPIFFIAIVGLVFTFIKTTVAYVKR